VAEEFITRGEYEERLHRVDDENTRQNKRIDKLEEIMTQINNLTASVRELATQMQAFQREQERQGKRLDSIEDEPADKWRTLVKTVLTVAVSAFITYVLTKGGI